MDFVNFVLNRLCAVKYKKELSKAIKIVVHKLKILTNLSKIFMQVEIIEKWENGWNFFYFLEKQEMPGMIWKSLKCLEIWFFLVNCSNNYQKIVFAYSCFENLLWYRFPHQVHFSFYKFLLDLLTKFSASYVEDFFFLKSSKFCWKVTFVFQ